MKASHLLYGIVFSLLIFCFAFTKNITVKGKVVDEAGNPVTYASVTIEGSQTGTSTDTAGNFSIEVPGKGSVLLIAAVGRSTKKVKVNNENLLVTLTGTNQILSDVIVTYGSKRKAGHVQTRGYATVNSGTTPQMAKDEEVYYDKTYGTGDSLEYNDRFNREGYERIIENPFLKVTDNPLSTFSIDVDAASYSNVRRMLNNNQLPPAGAVRIEEMINYFTYRYPQPAGDDPFSINTEIAQCPWNSGHRLVSIGLQGKKIPTDNLPPSNLTFLIDVSGSMGVYNKLPLVKASLKMLADQLREQDKVSIVVYAGNAGLVLPPTPGADKIKIKTALDELEAGGSPAGGEGIQLAYKTATANFIKSGNNRVILCTDGDFNVGQSSDDELERLIEKERESGVFLTVLGFGMGNYQDAKMQKLADKGNGNHAYIDNDNEAKKVLVHEFGGTLFTIAKDVKLQIEFNPAKVQGYRLIGYENRLLAKEDFNNDKKDAGELGSGHTVTALYEVIPVGVASAELDSVDALKYQKPVKHRQETAFSGELINIKLRYKQPDGKVSKLLQQAVNDENTSITTASDNLKLATAVAEFGMLLRNSSYKGSSNYATLLQLALTTLTNDEEGYRKEFAELVKKAQKLSKDVAAAKGFAE